MAALDRHSLDSSDTIALGLLASASSADFTGTTFLQKLQFNNSNNIK